MDLKGWTFCLTLGNDLYIYGKGKRRVAIDGKSGKEFLFYDATTDIPPQEDENEIYGKALQELREKGA